MVGAAATNKPLNLQILCFAQSEVCRFDDIRWVGVFDCYGLRRANIGSPSHRYRGPEVHAASTRSGFCARAMMCARVTKGINSFGDQPIVSRLRDAVSRTKRRPTQVMLESSGTLNITAMIWKRWIRLLKSSSYPFHSVAIHFK